MKADKGSAVVLWNVDDYQREALRQLKDNPNYHLVSQSVFNNPQPIVNHPSHHSIVVMTILHQLRYRRNEFVKRLELSRYISAKEADSMMKIEGRIPTVSFQPKAQSPPTKSEGKLRGRPIVNASMGPLFLLDKYMSQITSPLLSTIPGSISSSNHLLKIIESKEVYQNQHKQQNSSKPRFSLNHYCDYGHEWTSDYMGFATADVISMFPSIPIDDGIRAASDFYEERYAWMCAQSVHLGQRRPVDPPLFEEILRFLVTNSYISFQDEYVFHQTKGTAMGGCVSVFVANAYMYRLTRSTIERPPIWLQLFQRYVDDFVIFGCFHPHHGRHLAASLFESISNQHIRFTVDHEEPKCVVDAEVVSSPDAAQQLQSTDLPTNSIVQHIPKARKSKRKRRKQTKNALADRKERFRSCNFLDVTLSFDHHNHSRITYQPYFKPFVYSELIHRTSNHPPMVFKNGPVMHLIRLKRLSSTKSAYMNAYRRVKKQMISKGYSSVEAHRALLQVELRTRSEKTWKTFDFKKKASSTVQIPAAHRSKNKRTTSNTLEGKYDSITCEILTFLHP